MFALGNKKVLVIGLGASGKAACQLLVRRGARVLAIDSADTAWLRQEALVMSALGARVELGATAAPGEEMDLAVLSPGVPRKSALVRAIVRRGVPLIGELELGYQQSLCPNVAITGTNGKTTTTELVERMLTQAGRKTVAAGNIGRPLCAVVEQTKELDFLTLEVSSFQLETIQYFRPAVGVLLNITPDHLDRYRSMADYARAKARLFQNQQPFDWAIIQSEALAQLRALHLPVNAKVITFSATDSQADLYLDRGLIIGRLPEWSGPLLDMDHCRLRGVHNAENLMATLAVGRVLRIPWDQIVEALKGYQPAAHRCELVADTGGIKFVNDSKATNLDAVQKALLSMPAGKEPGPNVWLIAGGRDKGFEFHDLGPLLAQRVKGAFLLGEAREKIRAAWGLFTPCTFVDSLLEAVTGAAHSAVAGDVVLLSPACSSFDMFQNYQHRGEVFRQAVGQWARARQEPGAGSGSADPGARADHDENVKTKHH
ncbi:MAG: UDP-N-acetylmuramoyl-L-alanine--D-glutamate ligase [Limisphaerales bacterium]